MCLVGPLYKMFMCLGKCLSLLLRIVEYKIEQKSIRKGAFLWLLVFLFWSLSAMRRVFFILKFSIYRHLLRKVTLEPLLFPRWPPPSRSKEGVASELGVTEIDRFYYMVKINSSPLTKYTVGAFQCCSANVFSTNVVKKRWWWIITYS